MLYFSLSLNECNQCSSSLNIDLEQANRLNVSVTITILGKKKNSVTAPNGQATIWCKNIPEKLNPLSRVHARHRRQTDGFAVALARRHVVTFG